MAKVKKEKFIKGMFMLVWKRFSALILLLSSFAALADCGVHIDDLVHHELDWREVAIYRVSSPYADIHGTLCAGLDDKGRISRAHYRDNKGIHVYKSLSQLKERDIVFFAYHDFPLAARWVMRHENPLTIKLVNESKIGPDSYHYSFSAKFLRNPRKGFSSSDIREIVFDYFSGSNTTSFMGTSVDEIYLDMNAALNLHQVWLMENGRVVQGLDPFNLNQAKRNLQEN